MNLIHPVLDIIEKLDKRFRYSLWMCNGKFMAHIIERDYLCVRQIISEYW